jgi:Ca2+-binding RTX toxin-like protein
VERIGTTDYLSSEAIYLTGNEFAQEMIANNGNNSLSGEGGNDFLVGLLGADMLDGGSGLDVTEGGGGDDIHYVDNVGDVVRENAGEGWDAVYASSSYTLPTGAEVELLGTRNYLSTEGAALAGNEFNNAIVGNHGSNLLTGGAGSDHLSGLDGADTLDGGAGQDFLSGGAGADTYRFAAASNSAPGAGDTVLDFTSGTDKIDLSLIDANTGTANEDAFTSVGSAAFSGKAGELRWDSAGAQTFVYGDVNGDGVADFQIVVNTAAITSGDFIL